MEIPKGWQKLTLRDITIPKGLQTGPFGSQLKASEYIDGMDGVPIVMPKDINKTKIILKKCAYTTLEKSKKLSKHYLRQGDILFPRRGELGRIGVVTRTNLIALCGTGCLRARLNDKASYRFLIHYLQQHSVRTWLNENAVGQTMLNLNTIILSQIPIFLPPLSEQKKIAEILSTWDRAIEVVEGLIKNSQAQKKALMQQLLTAKKRLPGFDGEWKKIELGKLLDYKQPTPFLVKSTMYSEEYKTPVLTAGKTFVLGHTNEEFGIYKNNLPVIIFDDFTTASKFVNFPFKAKSSAMKMLTSKEGVSTKYIFEAMQIINYPVGGHQRHWISIYSNLVVSLPYIQEQTAIATILSDADREVEILNQQLTQLKSEKSALMQQLLTGKRRVKIDKEAVDA